MKVNLALEKSCCNNNYYIVINNDFYITVREDIWFELAKFLNIKVGEQENG